MERIECDVLVLGGGGAALRAAIEAAHHDLNVVLVSKGPLGRSGCTVMAEGGYNAVLRTASPDDTFDLHFRDTVEGGAYLNDQRLVEILVREAPDRLLDLERYGAVFTRREDGTLAQRPFGGQSRPRTCYAGDRTGHEIAMALLDELRRLDRVRTLEHVMAYRLITDDEGRVLGALCVDLEREEELTILAHATVLATGGAGQLYPITTNPAYKTGDGYAMALHAGCPLIDMEMVQFHPTGMVYPESARGILVTEAVRGEGGRLYNADGERFMKRYDPDRMELATRDVVARAIYREIREGRGTEHGGVYLDVTHLPDEVIETKLETTLRQFLRYGVDIRKEPMEVAPTAHHFMGGIPINERAETPLPRLFACGEVTGGVHGANRLGGNALADTQVFGRRAGLHAARLALRLRRRGERPRVRASRLTDPKLDPWTHVGEEDPLELRRELRQVMWKHVGLERSERGLKRAIQRLNELQSRVNEHGVDDEPGLRIALETVNMIQVGLAVARSALFRRESRGAHYRTDHPDRDDENWLKHTVYRPDGRLETRPVDLRRLDPRSG
ncbi:MAG: fumarate reductase (CoM/CoB) subunit TfrA [Euryarchaeota archaeon]